MLDVWWYGPGYPEPDNNPPNGRITGPIDGSYIGDGILYISADAWDDVSGVDHVEFWAWLCDASCNWQSLGTDYSAPYQTSFDWSARGDGQYTLALTVWDKTGKVRYDAGGWVAAGLDRSKPTVNISSPTNGANLSSSQLIQVSGSDSTSGIWKMQFFAGYSDIIGASLQSVQTPPYPAILGKNEGLSVSDVSAQDYWHEIGWDENGSDGWSFNWNTSSIPEQSGISVFVYAYDYAGNYQGAVQYDLSLFGPPSNDNINSAKTIDNVPYSDNMNTSAATVDTQYDPLLTNCPADLGQRFNSVWYRFTPPSSNVYSIDTFGSGYDTVLGIWSGNRGALTSVGCNDDSGSGTQSSLNPNLVGGQMYYIEIAGYTGPLATGLSTQPEDKLNVAGDIGALSGGTLIFHISESHQIYLPLVIR